MWREGATVLVLRPGRETLRFRLSARWPYQALGMLLVPILMGAAGRHGWEALHREPLAVQASLAHLSKRALGSQLRAAIDPKRALARRSVVRAHAEIAHAVYSIPERALAPLLTSVRPSSDPRVIDAQPIVRAFRSRAARDARLNEAAALLDPSTPFLLHATHLGESARVQAFDEQGMPRAEGFAQVTRLMRCRVTGEEVATDPRLVRLLARLGAFYGKPIQLFSGHRAVNTLGTSETSQHALGRAADIRIAGVSIEDLRRRAIELGAVGVGLYPEKGFVHVDVRRKARFHWVYTEHDGEQPYERFVLGAHIPADGADGGVESSETSGESE